MKKIKNIFFATLLIFINSYIFAIEKNNETTIKSTPLENKANSTECVIFSQLFIEILTVVDDYGNISNIPIVKKDLSPPICLDN